MKDFIKSSGAILKYLIVPPCRVLAICEMLYTLTGTNTMYTGHEYTSIINKPCYVAANYL